jgi:RHS repeat-associated protein
VAKEVVSGRVYLLSDRLSVRVMLDGSGNVIGRQAHLPYGEDFAESGTQQKHHFTSYERDAESWLDYAISRMYSSGLGRFMQSDPYRASVGPRDPQSWNRYSYSRNDPVNRVDPVGFEDLPAGLEWRCTNCEVTVYGGSSINVSDIPEGVSIGIIGRSNIGQLLGGDESGEGGEDGGIIDLKVFV